MICLTGGMDQKIMAHAFDAESKSVSALYECIGHVGSVEAITPMDNVHQVCYYFFLKHGFIFSRGF